MGMQEHVMFRLLGEIPRLWAVRPEWYAPAVELTAHDADEGVLSSTISPGEDCLWWLLTSYQGGGQRVFELHPDAGMTLLQAMKRAGGSLQHEQREFVVVDKSVEVVGGTHPILGEPFKWQGISRIRRVTVYRPPAGYRDFNHLLEPFGS